jgi:hypothetical protein
MRLSSRVCVVGAVLALAWHYLVPGGVISTYPEPDYSPWFKTRDKCEAYLRYAERKAALSGIYFDPEPDCEAEEFSQRPTSTPTPGSAEEIVGWGLFSSPVRPDGPPAGIGAYDSEQDCERARHSAIRYRHEIPPLPVCHAVGPQPEIPGVPVSTGTEGGPFPKCAPGEIGRTDDGQPCWDGPIIRPCRHDCSSGSGGEAEGDGFQPAPPD